MFLDDEIVQIAESRDWTHWSTREKVNYDIIKLLHKRFVDIGNENTQFNDILIEVKKVKNAFTLATKRLEKKGVYLHLSWHEVVSILYPKDTEVTKKLKIV